RYLELPPFRHHGAPGIDYFRAIEDQRRPYVRFRWCDYVRHVGQGSLRRVAARGDRANQFYAFARDEVQRRPSTPERIAREARLGRALDAFLAAAPARAGVAVHRVARPVGPASRHARTPRGWIAEAGAWAKWGGLGSAMRRARRLGLVQEPREARALLRIVRELRPTRVVEVGTAHGGSFLLWARAAAPDATLVSVDLPP